MNIYVASSWRNLMQPGIVEMLRKLGHEVYDFRHPGGPGSSGFSWRGIDAGWANWDPDYYKESLKHPLAEEGFARDMNALKAADAVLLVLPCGRSAHLELGWAVGAGKKTAVMMLERQEPDLMYKMCGDILTSMDQFFDWAGLPAKAMA